MKLRNGAGVRSGGGGGNPSPRRAYVTMSMPPDPDPEPPSADPADFVAFAAAWQAFDEPTHEGMAQDEAHQREMVAATGVIAPRASCTHVAVQDGNWTDSTTWLVVATGLFGVPGAGDRVGVPSGINVTMNNNTTTVYHSLRVDGKVTWAINQDTKLYIDDTIVINHGGEWLHGTVANPIPAAYTSEVVFPSQTNLDGAKGKLLLQRGFIGMGANSMHPDGKIHIHGQVKDHWATTSATVAVGATSVTLDAAPTGWEVGDEIHLMETTIYGWNSSFPLTWSPRHIDNVTITAISGDGLTITFTPATTYDHDVPSFTGMTDLKWYVVNFTRNVKYYSPVDTPVHQRGHWMGMSDGIDVRWASFDWLGRTNKALDVPSFNATDDAARIAENGGAGDPDFTPTDNVRGRYNFHIHRSGVAIGQEFATVTGIACTEAPGWLIAHHQSNANFTKCVGRNFRGSGMVAELAAEAGKWLDCFMGEGKQILTAQGAQSDKKEYTTDTSFGVTRTYDDDFGRNNNAYWFKGRGVEVDGCVAAGADRGFVWMARGGGDKPTVANLPYDARIWYGREQEAGAVGTDTPVLLVKNCKMVCVKNPIIVIKSSPDQEHNFRTHIHSNDMWELNNSMEFEYTGHYTLDNNRIAYSRIPRNLRDRHAIGIVSNSGDFYVSNNIVRGFTDSVVRNFISNTLFPTYDYGNVVVDNHSHDAATLLVYSGADIPDKTISTRIVDPADLSSADPTWTPAAEPVWPNYSIFGFDAYVFVGDLTTEFGTRNRSHETSTTDDIARSDRGLSSRFGTVGLGLMLSRYGYYTYTHPTHGASNYLLVPDVISKKLPPTPGADIPVRYLTVPVRLTGVSLGDYTNQGALPTRYVDCIALGDPAITDPGSPAAGAAAYVVYEDIKDVGNLYEGL